MSTPTPTPAPAPAKTRAQARRDVCKACPHRIGLFCGKCGCVIAAKTSIPGATCPAGHW